MDRRAGRAEQPPRVKALDVDGVRTVAIITVLWAVAFVVLALQRTQLDEAGRGWWIWTCLAGVGLGLLGLEYCRKRRDAIAKAELEDEADAGFDDVGDWRDGELAQLAAEEHAELGHDEPAQVHGYDEDQPPYAEPLPGHPQAEVFPPAPYRGAERPATPPQSPYPGPDQPGPHRPDQPGPHRPEHSPTYSPGGRPPPGYKTGEFPAVPATPPAAGPPAPAAPLGPSTPLPGSEPQHRTPDVATPAGYSPDPERTRRHPRDEERARRREEHEQARQTDTGSRRHTDFLADEDGSDYAAAGAGYPEPSPAEPEPDYRDPGTAYNDVQLDYGEPAPQYTGSDSYTGSGTGYSPGEYDPGDSDEPEPPYREPERSAPAGSELLSDLLGDEPAPPSHAPEFLVDDEPAADQDDDYGGEYRGRRARRD